jgi:hypothetical protein
MSRGKKEGRLAIHEENNKMGTIVGNEGEETEGMKIAKMVRLF